MPIVDEDLHQEFVSSTSTEQKGFGVPNSVKAVTSSKSRWFKPRYHVVLTDGGGNIDEVWHDASFMQTVFLLRYFETHHTRVQ